MNVGTSSSSRPLLSVVVPAYNEEQRFREPLAEILRYLETAMPGAELVIVDDGSRDRTFEIARSLTAAATIAVAVCRYADNRGKGYALKVGFEIARGEAILFCDADLATPIEEAPRLLEALSHGADIAIGSRKMKGATITTHQSWLRENLGKVFTWLVRRSIADVSDATCGFKAFRRQQGQELFRRSRIHDWTFDAEILLLASRRGFRIAEVPVRWADAPGTKVRLGRDILRSLENLVRLKRDERRGVYETDCPVSAPLETSHNAAWSKFPTEEGRKVA